MCHVVALRMTSTAHMSIIFAVVPDLTAGPARAMQGKRAVLASTAAVAGAALMVGMRAVMWYLARHGRRT